MTLSGSSAALSGCLAVPPRACLSALPSYRRTVAQVDRVHKGGSYGRKTSVQGHFDVDLLVFVNGLDCQDTAQVDALLLQVCKSAAGNGRVATASGGAGGLVVESHIA